MKFNTSQLNINKQFNSSSIIKIKINNKKKA